MPSYFGAGISIYLGSLPLSESTTPKVVIGKGEVAAWQCEAAEKKLRESEFLDEERVQFPGDEENFAVNWVAEAPFLQVLAGGDAFKVSRKKQQPGRTRSLNSVRGVSKDSKDTTPTATLGIRQSLRRATRARPPESQSATRPAQPRMHPTPDRSGQADGHKPQALVLHVMLTNKTFYRSVVDGSAQHLKIDVFFNGQLSSCVLIHQGEIRTGTKSMHQVFAGTRVDFLVERPWVIYPPGQNAEGRVRETSRPTGGQERWGQICQALMRAANDRGVDEDGGRPPSAEYLKELARMARPENVSDMQKPGGRDFGVVDVIVTVGIGNKTTIGTNYLLKPMLLADQRFSYEVNEQLTQEKGSTKEQDVTDQREEHLHKGYLHDVREGIVQIDGQNDRLPDKNGEGRNDLEDLAIAPSARRHLNSAPPLAFYDLCMGSPKTAILPKLVSLHSIQPLSESTLDAIQGRQGKPFDFAASYNEHDPWSHQHLRAHGETRSYSSAPAPAPAPWKLSPPTNPNPSSHSNQFDGFMHTNPYKLSHVHMMVDHDPTASSGASNLSSTDGPTLNPLRHDSAGQLTLPPFDSLFADSRLEIERTGFPLERTSSYFPTPDLLPSQDVTVFFEPASVYSNPSNAPSKETLSNQVKPTYGSLSQPARPYGSSPLLPRSMSRNLPPALHMTSFMRPDPVSMGPLPPIGLFSATKKPKIMPPKHLGITDPDQPRSSILVRRLSITGVGGKTIVNRTWASPQRVEVTSVSTGQYRLHKKSHSPTKPRQKRTDSSEYVDSGLGMNRQGSRVAYMATPPPTSPNKPNNSNTKTKTHQNSVQQRTAQESTVSRPNPLGLAAIPPALTGEAVRSAIESRDFPSTSKATAVDALKLVPTARWASSSRNLRTRGTKPTERIFDDPEELLHRPFKCGAQERSTSPTKLDKAPAESRAGLASDAKTRAMSKVLEHVGLEMDSTSPLSSLTSSPEMPTELVKVPHRRITILPLPAAAVPMLPKSSQTLPSAQAPSRPKVTFSNSQNGTIAQLVKKKTTHALQSQTGPRKRGPRGPRNPDRLSAKENPKLNNNCVLQYAVSDVQGEALRQVKSERQGVFTEESVVVGMRFFVAG